MVEIFFVGGGGDMNFFFKGENTKSFLVSCSLLAALW